MARALRKTAQGCTHHCFTRCHGKRGLIKSSFGKKCLIEAIRMCQEKYIFHLIAAENVGDHIHVLIKTIKGEADISRIMQYIKARTAEKYNRGMNTSGAYCNERFGSKVIEDATDPEQYLLHTLWYIGYNPCKKGLSGNPRMNDIGFINCYLDKNHEAPVKITLHPCFMKLGMTHKTRVKKLLQYEQRYLDIQKRKEEKKWERSFW